MTVLGLAIHLCIITLPKSLAKQYADYLCYLNLCYDMVKFTNFSEVFYLSYASR